MFSHDNGQRLVERHLDRIMSIFIKNKLQDIEPSLFIGANTLNQDFEALASPLISVQTSQTPQKLSFAVCRHCSGHFEYRLREGATRHYWLPNGSPYTAIPYVWGETSPQQIGCDNCDAIMSVQTGAIALVIGWLIVIFSFYFYSLYIYYNVGHVIRLILPTHYHSSTVRHRKTTQAAPIYRGRKERIVRLLVYRSRRPRRHYSAGCCYGRHLQERGDCYGFPPWPWRECLSAVEKD